MLNTIIHYILVLSLFSIFLPSCSQEEFIEETVEVIDQEPQESTEKALIGELLDFDNVPIPDMVVTMFSNDIVLNQTVTDEQGNFILTLENIEAPKVFLTFEKDGFIPIEKLVSTEKSLSFTRHIANDYCPVDDRDIINTFEGIEMVTISGTAFHENGDPAVNERLKFRDDTEEFPLFIKPVIVDNNGYWEVAVPRDIELRVFYFACLDFGVKKLGSFSTDTDIGPITDIPGLNTITYANPTTCDGDPVVENGFSMLFAPFHNTGMISYFPTANFPGNHFCGPVCDPQTIYTLFAYDNDANTYAINKKQVDYFIDFSGTETCTPFENEITATLDGVELPILQKSFLQINYMLDLQTPENIFTSWNNFTLGWTLTGENDDNYRIHLHIPRDDFELGKNIQLPLFDLAQQEGAYEYGNFKGTFIVDKIENGYAHGSMNGTVNRAPNNYPEIRPHIPVDYDNIDRDLKVEFKILMID